MKSYTSSVYKYRRRKTIEVGFGKISLGGHQPIRVESMVTADTMNTEAVVKQCRELYDVNCEIIRITAPTVKSADNLRNIRDQLRKDGIDTPLVADIHFTPKAAMKAVEFMENVRINPGNFADRKWNLDRDLTDDEYNAELERLYNEFKPLVLKAKEYGVSMRIGTNHGSLSDRIMNRYGDSPQGMAESALEFARICEDLGYHDILFSMKSSNVRVMIEAYRVLVAKADASLKHAYPLHLGVTEAGDGDEGRIKSSMGIGSLLEDGLGDTIRVSLTENPVHEIPIGYAIVKKYNDRLYVSGQRGHEPINQLIDNGKGGQDEALPFDPYDFKRFQTQKIELNNLSCGGDSLPRVEVEIKASMDDPSAVVDDIVKISRLDDTDSIRAEICGINLTSIDQFNALESQLKLKDISPVLSVGITDTALVEALKGRAPKIRLNIREGEMLSTKFLTSFDPGTALEFCFLKKNASSTSIAGVLTKLALKCRKNNLFNVFFSIEALDSAYAYRKLVQAFKAENLDYPLIIRFNAKQIQDRRQVLVHSSIQAGALFSDGIGDALAITSSLSYNDEINFAYNILQASRLRLSKTEFISCPGCGRTLFDLERTTEKIKSRISHLKGLKIGIMGCIVNGPGEMADADFGYVGTGSGQISLYVGKECVQKHIPEAEALDRLVDLIKEHGKWVEPKATEYQVL